ncbi:energy transducer TonB [uncultured Shewanella sp.]|uniref:energy transducer TonB n=1 Tax=uncultured Shewanella sp. TaxID=173975 RepID=UPI002630CFAC|nr:energy transducer TonB [uncultured Shewanella sp.]
MTLRFILAGAVFSLLSACSSSPDILLNQNPKVIDVSELTQYWIQDNDYFRMNIGPKRMPPKDTEGFVEIRYLIDSNGNVFNPEIVKSEPEGFWDYSGMKALSKIQYKKADTNPLAVPVYVTTRIEFKF